jgi:hypothetical protein
MPDSFEANSGFEGAGVVKGECRACRTKATLGSVAVGVPRRNIQKGRLQVQVLVEGSMGQHDLVRRFPHEEPPNKPLKRTKPSQTVLENRGSQPVPAFVYHRPPDDASPLNGEPLGGRAT